MKNSRQNNCDDVVELLVKKYWAKSKAELDQEIGKITQDFINRNLFNSTRRVSKQLHTEFEYVQKLIEYIFEFLKQDFSNITPTSCKDKLLSIVESEYKKLIPRTISRLVESNLGQKSILENYENGIIDKMEKSKANIEIQCAISEKQKVFPKGNAEKWYQSRTIQAALITAGVLLLVSIVGWLIILYVNKSDDRSDVGTTISNEPEISGDFSPAITSTGPNSPSIVDYNTPGSKQLHAEPPPIIRRSEELIQPEETEGDANQPKSSPILKIRETSIAPEEDAGEVNEPKKPEHIKRKEKQIEPEDK